MAGNEEVRDRAFIDYQKGMKYKEIAEKYGVSLSAVKSWAVRYWKEKGCNREEKKLQLGKKKVATNEGKQKAIAEEVNQVIETPGLTDKQRFFCLYYVRCFNATKAYQKAYGCDEHTARVNGSRLLTIDNIRDEIKCLKQNRLNRELLDESDIFQKYMDIAFADMNDFVEISEGMVHVRQDLDGTLLSELSDTANGVKVKLADRMKALQWLTDHMDLATSEQRTRIAVMKSQLESDKEVPIQITFRKAGETVGDKDS